MDSWTLKRLTINPGLRVEWYKASVREASMPAGRAFLAENAPGVRTSELLAWSDAFPSVEVRRA